MALIICPECGGKISSNSDNCIHCGYKFVVCPECEAVLKSDTTSCPECGFALNNVEKKSTENTNTKSNTTNSDASNDTNYFNKTLSSWKAQSTKAAFYYNKIITPIFTISFMLTSLWSFITLFKWVITLKSPNNLDSLSELKMWANAPEIIKKTCLLVWISIVLSILVQLIFTTYKKYLLSVDFLEWATLKKIDPVLLVKQGLQIDFDKKQNVKDNLKDDLYIVSSSFAYFNKATLKVKYYNTMIITTILYIASNIFVGLFITSNIKAYVQQFVAFSLVNPPKKFTLFGTFDFVEWKFLIIAVVLFIVKLILDKNKKSVDKAILNWGKENLDSDYDLFNTLITESKWSTTELKKEYKESLEKDKYDLKHKI